MRLSTDYPHLFTHAAGLRQEASMTRAGDAADGSLVDVILDRGTSTSTERLCPDGAPAEEFSAAGCIKLPTEDDEDVEEAEAARERRSQCCWVLVLVPSCSLILTAALATLTVGALMAASCSVQAQYDSPCHVVRDAILNTTNKDSLLPSASFRVLSSDSTHVTLRHMSPVNGAKYHVYFLLKTGEDQSCTCLSLAASSIWFQPDDAGAGFCALQHLTNLGLTARTASGPTCNSQALSVCAMLPSEAPPPSSTQAIPPAPSNGSTPSPATRTV